MNEKKRKWAYTIVMSLIIAVGMMIIVLLLGVFGFL